MQSGREDTLEERYAIKFCFKLGKNATETYGMLQTAFRPSCMNQASVFEWHKRFEEGRESVRDDERCGRSKEVNTPELIGQTVRVRVIMLRFSWSSGKESKGRGQHSSNRVSGISTRTMHQSTTQSLSQIIWPRWASRQFLSLPIFQTLLPVTYGYSLSSESVVMRQLRGWKRLWRHAHTKGLPWGLPEVVGTVQQVHCSRRILLGRGLEFHECTINKSAHTKKVWKLIVSTSYIYTYIYCIFQILNDHFDLVIEKLWVFLLAEAVKYAEYTSAEKVRPSPTNRVTCCPWVATRHTWREDPGCWAVLGLVMKWSSDRQHSTSALTGQDRWSGRPDLIIRLVTSSSSTFMIVLTVFFKWLYTTLFYFTAEFFIAPRLQYLKPFSCVCYIAIHEYVK